MAVGGSGPWAGRKDSFRNPLRSAEIAGELLALMHNPFREDLVSRARAEACTVVILGATGDLTHRKLVPALYNLAADGELPPGVKIVGCARRDWSDEFFRESLEKPTPLTGSRIRMSSYGPFLNSGSGALPITSGSHPVHIRRNTKPQLRSANARSYSRRILRSPS